MNKKSLIKLSGLFLLAFILLILGQKTMDILNISYQVEGLDLLEMFLLLISMTIFSLGLVFDK